MLAKCEDNNFPCQVLDYSDFDQIAQAELSNPISAHEWLNESEFCMPIPIDKDFTVGDLNHKLFLKPLKGQAGLYHLWSDYENCDDHGTYTLKCAYVGKGPPDTRIAAHIRDKWPNGVNLYATFTAMQNRLSKYYEQLFLDIYNFELNTAENNGTETLFAVWDDERHLMGTHSNETSNLSKMQTPDDW